MFKEYSDFMTAKEAMDALGIGKNLMYSLEKHYLITPKNRQIEQKNSPANFQ